MIYMGMICLWMLEFLLFIQANFNDSMRLRLYDILRVKLLQIVRVIENNWVWINFPPFICLCITFSSRDNNLCLNNFFLHLGVCVCVRIFFQHFWVNFRDVWFMNIRKDNMNVKFDFKSGKKRYTNDFNKSNSLSVILIRMNHFLRMSMHFILVLGCITAIHINLDEWRKDLKSISFIVCRCCNHFGLPVCYIHLYINVSVCECIFAFFFQLVYLKNGEQNIKVLWFSLLLFNT